MKRNGNGKRPRRLLLVDDDAKVLTALEAGLANRFEIVASCASGEEALRAMAPDQRADLVLLDIKMPGMDGIECCRKLRRRFPDLPIAMHTAKAVQERFEEARLAGADAYILKGVAMEKLATTLQRLEHREGQCVCVAGNGPAQPAEGRQATVLTPSQTRVVELLSQGLTQKEVAGGLRCSLRNVRKHLAASRRRLCAGTLAQLIRLWTEKRNGS